MLAESFSYVGVKMKTLNIVIALFGLFAMLRILVGISLANWHQLKTKENQVKLDKAEIDKADQEFCEKHPFRGALFKIFGARAINVNKMKLKSRTFIR